MTEQPTPSELETWRVAELSDDFADRVLARLADEAAIGDDANMPDATHEDRQPVPPLRALSRPRPSSTERLGFVCIAAAAALALLWLLRPAPPVPGSPPPRVPVAIAPPILAEGTGLDREAIRRTLGSQFNGYARLCYEALAISSGHPVSGQLLLHLDVVRSGGRGVVTRAELDSISELEDPVFRECILARARTLAFDPPHGDAPVEIVLPLEFQDPWAADPFGQ
jgi:hypothetical protein